MQLRVKLLTGYSGEGKHILYDFIFIIDENMPILYKGFISILFKDLKTIVGQKKHDNLHWQNILDHLWDFMSHKINKNKCGQAKCLKKNFDLINGFSSRV